MTTLLSALDWRAMSQEERDLGLNNGVAAPGSVEMVAGWEQRSGEMRRRYPDHLDLRYGTRERNRIDFLKAREGGPTLLFIHGGYWQARAKEVFTVFAEGPIAHGINVALIGYTLAPEATLDEIVAEIHGGIDFLTGQLPALGAAPGDIVVSGWSAGGHLTSAAVASEGESGDGDLGHYDLEAIRRPIARKTAGHEQPRRP
jgi:acetyl esterase/lipase